MVIRSTRLKCSKHLVFLVLNSHIVARPSGPVRIEFWECPLLCGYVRARKDQKKPVKPRAKQHRVSPKTKFRSVPSNDQQASFGFTQGAS